MFHVVNGAIHNDNYMEMYFPAEYFKNNYYAINLGNKVNIFGLFPLREFIDGKPQELKMLQISTFIDIKTYQTKADSMTYNGTTMNVITSSYPPDSHLFQTSIVQNMTIAEKFLEMIMDGKVPPIINYLDLINIMWRSLEIAGVNLNVPSTMYEVLIMTMCRNKNNMKERFGISFGKFLNIEGTDYIQLNTRTLVANLSTFSGIVFEDMNRMILNGISNHINSVEEPVSPLEQIIHY